MLEHTFNLAPDGHRGKPVVLNTLAGSFCYCFDWLRELRCYRSGDFEAQERHRPDLKDHPENLAT